jgi:hypothetical protein
MAHKTNRRSVLCAICIFQTAIIFWLLYARQSDLLTSAESKNPATRRSGDIERRAKPPKPDDISIPNGAATNEPAIEHPVSATTLSRLVADSVLKAGSLEVNPQIAHSLRLSREEIHRVNEILSRHAEAYSIASVSNAQLVKTPAGDTFFRIAPSTELSRLGNSLRSALSEAVGLDAGNAIAGLTARSPLFLTFGEHSVDIYLEDIVNPDGVRQRYISATVGDSTSDDHGLTSHYLVTPEARNPLYEGLITKFRTALQE